MLVSILQAHIDCPTIHGNIILYAWEWIAHSKPIGRISHEIKSNIDVVKFDTRVPFFAFCVVYRVRFSLKWDCLFCCFVISINKHWKCAESLQNIQFHTFWLFFKCKSYGGNFISSSSFLVGRLFVRHTVGRSVG